jgi:hypothetical protein
MSALAIASLSRPDAACARCAHPEADHCQGGKPHSGWLGKGGLQLCASRHCEQPLCSCIDFQAGGAQ